MFKLIFQGLMLTGVSALWACSSLNRSPTDRFLKSQGSFVCAKKTIHLPYHETPAQADVARVRCSQDRLVIRAHQIQYERIFYKDFNCQNALGSLTSKQMDRQSCVFIRSDVDWTAEENGKCMLNSLEPKKPQPLQVISSCRGLVPDFCDPQTAPIQIKFKNSDSRQANDELEVTSHSEHEICLRYLSEEQ